MRINFNRLSQLAGLPANNNRKGLYESADAEGKEGFAEGEASGVTPFDESLFEEEGDEPPTNESFEEAHLDEIIEIDEVMLVQELRRAKKIMNENKRRNLNESRRQSMFESQLKQVIDEEVQNVIDEMQLTSQWVYGNKRPTRSRNGYTHQGSMMPGIEKLIPKMQNLRTARHLIHLGPMARSIEDLKLLLKILTGPDSNDVSSIDIPIIFPEPKLIKNLKISWTQSLPGKFVGQSTDMISLESLNIIKDFVINYLKKVYFLRK